MENRLRLGCVGVEEGLGQGISCIFFFFLQLGLGFLLGVWVCSIDMLLFVFLNLGEFDKIWDRFFQLQLGIGFVFFRLFVGFVLLFYLEGKLQRVDDEI